MPRRMRLPSLDIAKPNLYEPEVDVNVAKVAPESVLKYTAPACSAIVVPSAEMPAPRINVDEVVGGPPARHVTPKSLETWAALLPIVLPPDTRTTAPLVLQEIVL